jgi:hypothetical protein
MDHFDSRRLDIDFSETLFTDISTPILAIPRITAFRFFKV